MAEMKRKTREEIIAADVQDLHKMGYAQKLFREMGGFSNFAISFSIICVAACCSVAARSMVEALCMI